MLLRNIIKNLATTEQSMINNCAAGEIHLSSSCQTILKPAITSATFLTAEQQAANKEALQRDTRALQTVINAIMLIKDNSKDNKTINVHIHDAGDIEILIRKDGKIIINTIDHSVL